MRARVLAAGLLLALAACTRGPDAEALQADVSARLAEALPDGGLELASFERRGSQADTHAPEGEERRILYFDADLKLTRDYTFGTWDGPGIAVLVSTLGAGPRGISGINSDGNRAGELLHVHGTVVYRKEGDAWTAVAAGGHEPMVAPSLAMGSSQDHAVMLLDEMRKVVEAAQRDSSGASHAVVDQELAAANAVIRARLARLEQGFAVAAGPESGQYLSYVRAAAAAAKARVVPLLTRGGEENLRLLRAGQVPLALAQADAALDAYRGTGVFAGDGPHESLRAIGSLYPEAVHVCVRSDSAYASVAELKGRRIAVGLPGSASRTTALRVLAAHGLDEGDFEALDLGPDEMLVAVQRDRADAALQVIGVPANSVRNALLEIPLRLVPLAPEAVAKLVASDEGYFAYTIARGSYATQRKDVPTIATAALLLVGSDLADSEVAAVTHFTYERGRDLAALGSAQGAQVSAANARLGVSVPIRDAALRALAEIK